MKIDIEPLDTEKVELTATRHDEGQIYGRLGRMRTNPSHLPK